MLGTNATHSDPFYVFHYKALKTGHYSTPAYRQSTNPGEPPPIANMKSVTSCSALLVAGLSSLVTAKLGFGPTLPSYYPEGHLTTVDYWADSDYLVSRVAEQCAAPVIPTC